MTLEQFLIYAFLASPFVIAILLTWVLLQAGIAFVLGIAIAAAGGWFARSVKHSMDREYGLNNWKWP